jgi:hypothetical protein
MFVTKTYTNHFEQFTNSQETCGEVGKTWWMNVHYPMHHVLFSWPHIVFITQGGDRLGWIDNRPVVDKFSLLTPQWWVLGNQAVVAGVVECPNFQAVQAFGKELVYHWNPGISWTDMILPTRPPDSSELWALGSKVGTENLTQGGINLLPFCCSYWRARHFNCGSFKCFFMTSSGWD